MISFKELLAGNLISDVPIKHQQNLEELLIKVNVLRSAYGKPLIVTSGYRSEQDHRRIYSKIGIKNPPMSSGHLQGKCVDFYDPKGEFKKWCLDNLKLVASLDLFLEDFRWTVNWVHVGTSRPASGKRIFKPRPGNAPHPANWNGEYDESLDDKL